MRKLFIEIAIDDDMHDDSKVEVMMMGALKFRDVDPVMQAVNETFEQLKLALVERSPSDAVN